MPKEIKARLAHLHDVEENWKSAGELHNFIPKAGEEIIYDVDSKYSYQRVKIGDGITNINDLPFYSSMPANGNDGQFLRWVDGAPAWSTVLRSEETYF